MYFCVITGRGRADDAKYYLLTETGSGAAQREDKNKIRENMMAKAIEYINELSNCEFIRQLERFQREAKKDREMAAKDEEQKRALKATRRQTGDFQLRCKKCDQLAAVSSDFRVIKGMHHVVIDEDFQERSVVEPHPKPIQLDDFINQGKLFCKGCKHEWGIQAQYRNVSVPILAIAKFVVIDPYDRRALYKKWKDAPFNMREIGPADIDRQLAIQLQQ